ASAIAWAAVGIAGPLITWQACTHHEQLGGASAHPGMRALNIVITLVLLAIAIIAGFLSYRNWRTLSGSGRLYQAEAKTPQEFLAFLGIFISITLGFGILWFGLPLTILAFCLRTR
ncbi:MAG TPA: hypothetical protein VFN53_04885, partial [Acidobacteriaceae bacterium]|nr:hypothetical protein [Acidobacteriaceae bacterium]